jgi:agmatinase
MGETDKTPHHWDTFLDSPHDARSLDDASVVLLPIPYDSTTSYRTGSRYGPKAIITSSRQLEDYDIELDRDISEVGIYTAAEVEADVSGPEAMVGRIEGAVRPLAETRKLVGVLGGEHTVTIGAVRAFRDVYPDLTVLYLDAHADLRDEYMGSPWSHACVARRIAESTPLVEVGVRSMSAEERVFADSKSVPIWYWPAAGNDVRDIANWALEGLSENVYVSIDLDVLDPSLMAAVGTPEPGGMGWSDVTSLLRAVAGSRRIVGFDITELSPPEGPEACAFTAAKLAYKLIGYVTDSAAI